MDGPLDGKDVAVLTQAYFPEPLKTFNITVY